MRKVRGVVCTVCDIPVGQRKLIEALLIAGAGVRECQDYTEFLVQKGVLKKTLSKSAIHRHEIDEHFVADPTKRITIDGQVMTVHEMVMEMLEAYQKAKKGKIPDDKSMRDWLMVDAKIADIETRRREDDDLRQMLRGIGYAKPIDGKFVETPALESGQTKEE